MYDWDKFEKLEKEIRPDLIKFIKYTHKEFPKGCSAINESYLYDENGEILGIPEYMSEQILKSIYDDFWYGESDKSINICGCGNPEYTEEIVIKILESRKIKDFHKREQFIKDSIGVDFDKNNMVYGLYQFVLYQLDDKQFLEHGSSISGAWLTEKGEVVLKIRGMIDRFNEIDE